MLGHDILYRRQLKIITLIQSINIYLFFSNNSKTENQKALK